MKPNSSIRFYTGFPSFAVLAATFRALKPTAQNMYSWSQMQCLRNKGIANVEGLRKTMGGCKLSLFDQFYLVLQKLRVGTLNQVLADTFDIFQTTVSRVFISWINFLYFMLGSTCIWRVSGHPGKKSRRTCPLVLSPCTQTAGALLMHLR